MRFIHEHQAHSNQCGYVHVQLHEREGEMVYEFIIWIQISEAGRTTTVCLLFTVLNDAKTNCSFVEIEGLLMPVWIR